ncbi:MAG: hypothetical protein CFK52_11695, partial [Chloracidobacterium sp. CP2_5A]
MSGLVIKRLGLTLACGLAFLAWAARPIASYSEATPFKRKAESSSRLGGAFPTSPSGFVSAVSSTRLLTPTTFIMSFSPTSGPVGATVTIFGAGFVEVSAVRFNNVNATFAVISPTQITATVPPGATTGPIAVTTPA